MEKGRWRGGRGWVWRAFSGLGGGRRKKRSWRRKRRDDDDDDDDDDDNGKEERGAGVKFVWAGL